MVYVCPIAHLLVFLSVRINLIGSIFCDIKFCDRVLLVKKVARSMLQLGKMCFVNKICSQLLIYV